MAYILINDVLDELKEENNKLLTENQLISDLLLKYRSLSMNFQKSCICEQKSNDLILKSLENEYQKIANYSHPNDYQLTDYSCEDIEEKGFKTKRRNHNAKSRQSLQKKAHPLNLFKAGSSKQLICEKCHRCFTHESRLAQHKMTIHSLSPRIYSCDYCELKMVRRDSLVRHLNLKHSSKKPFLIHKCWKCGQTFSTKLELKEHKSFHPKEVKQYECEECPKVFNCKINLNIHRNAIHSLNPKIYECDFCDFQTKWKQTLKSHTQCTHISKAPTVKCEYEGCHKLFKSRFILKTHMNLVHNPNSKKFVCDWPGCEHSYKRKAHLEEHKAAHLGVKKFKCDFEGCAMSFIGKRHLFSHQRFHRKPFECSWPGCDLTFGNKTLLSSHLNRHQNIRPFVCSFEGCGKGFFNDSNLIKHRKGVHKIQN